MQVSEQLRTHLPCPDCGSSDALAEYSDGHTYCYSCQTYHLSNNERRTNVEQVIEIDTENLKGRFRDIPDRGITKETCEKYGVRTGMSEHKIVRHYYPYYNSKGTMVAEKIRIVPTKEFTFKGDSSDVVLFGQNIFPASGKYITVTEGEVDCLSVYQMFGGKYPVVSIPNGCGSKKAILKSYDFLNSFDNIVLCYDGDKAGRESVIKIAELLPPKKVKIVKLPEDMKDPNEFLKAGKSTEFINLWWRAEEYRPADIVNIGDMFGRLSDYRKTHTYTSTPWQGVNEKIVGTRAGQLIVLASGTGMGKSAFLKTWMMHLLRTTEDKIGALYLEEVVEETVLSLMSLCANANLKRPSVYSSFSQEELQKFFDECGANRRVELFEPLSNTSPSYICDKIRYMVKARDCKYIFLDHLTYLVDDSDNIRNDLNKLCKDVHSLCVELGITVICACHLRKAQGSSTHEEGGRVTLDDLKDSSSIKQLTDVVLGLERNSQDEDPVRANTTIIRVLKNRDFGDKGVTSAVLYDKDTTILTEVPLESEESI